mmetsp:Transcript_3159/g.14671  ORF Transcript_3159/g.14671 Transcript_3159/m.14671 type:complete len:83 (+) Transcript_3159:2713-2961(+)
MLLDLEAGAVGFTPSLVDVHSWPIHNEERAEGLGLHAFERFFVRQDANLLGSKFILEQVGQFPGEVSGTAPCFNRNKTWSVS